ncbi:MAG: hypothetical protein V3R99_05340, partial [Thermoguttaceae bacterium]
PLNDLNPALGIYDAIGHQLAADLGSLDGKNADLVFAAPENGTYFVRIYAEEGSGEYLLNGVDTIFDGVVGRHVFYNNSHFDGNNAGADTQDFAAIATDKTALLPDRISSYANYTNYGRGINGIMVDIVELPGSTLLATAEAATSDFEFRVGNSNNPDTWRSSFDAVNPAPLPTAIMVFPGAGVGGSDRVAIIWPDNAIKNQWLQVTVKATANTGLLDDDIFYFGNAPGEAGDNAVNTIVNATDEVVVRNFRHGPLNPATIDDRYDYNRDGLVDGVDQIIARNNQTNPLTMLRLITAPAVAEKAFEQVSDELEIAAASLDWLYEFERISGSKRSSGKDTQIEKTVDMLLATLD